jgi:outer membrane lipoprotein-sorting protein
MGRDVTGLRGERLDGDHAPTALTVNLISKSCPIVVVMKFLRTVSTQRLIAILAGVIIAVAGGTAIAVAASSNGTVPPRESLAQALHQAATAPQVNGISARIHFTNNLISSSNLQGSDPILNGASGRLWVSNDGRMRLELQGDNGDAQVVVNNGKFSIYDPMSNTVYKGTLPSQGSGSSSGTDKIPTVAQIQAYINQLLPDVNIVGPTPRNVAGQPAYKIKVSPKHDGGLLGNIQLAWEAAHGVPLGIAIYAQGNPTPVLELKATQISFGPIPNSDLSITGHPGAKVVRVSPAAAGTASERAHAAVKHGEKAKHQTDVTGPAAVQAHLPFTLAAPDPLVGLQRQSVELLDWGGSPAALVTYGQGLGGIAVIEQSAPSGQQPQSSSGADQRGLTLPTISINGHSGQELATALGTVIRVTSGPVQYTVLGSVPAAAAEAAARALIP